MKISIITVVYNNKNYLEDAINSVLNQSYSNIEYIVIDGGSTDGTVDIIKKYDNNISTWVSEPDRGIYDAMNKGILLATGDVIGMLNSDDQLYDTIAIEKIVLTFKNNPVDCCYGNLVFVNNEDKIIRRWHSRPFEYGLFSKSWSPAHPTFYCKRELYEKYGLYKTNYKIAADVELMLRFLEVIKAKSVFIDEYIVKMQVGGVSNKGIKSTITITKEMQRAFRENRLSFNIGKYIFFKMLKLKEFIVYI